ncbi:hypothetical protein SEA_SIZEMORE_24 [Mycobacterium phage Sizemore]
MTMDIPEVRQCVDEASHMFGAVAVRAGVNRWGVMHPQHGGHWAGDVEVNGWPAGAFDVEAGE